MRTSQFTEAQRKQFPDASGVFPPENCGAMLLHSVLGITGEVGELASAVEKYAWYGQDFDRRNVLEELGDVLWYVAEACDALDMDLGQVMFNNIEKLRKRFPDKFDEQRALEENRDRENEVSHIGVDSAMPGAELTVEMLCGPASEGLIHPGTSYEFCWESEAEEWYDFHVNCWKKMSMAGHMHPSCKLFRRLVKPKQSTAASDDGVCYESHPETD